MADFVKVASLGELPPGAKKLLDLDGRAIALFNVEGQVYAIDDVCPRHGARFDVRTGKALCFPAFEPVETLAVEVRGDEIFVAPLD
jgi:3-phenylpropionate/trans-cinnamate dioxygenase ferredoxin subunit